MRPPVMGGVCVIPAAGLGTRMTRVTGGTPKELLRLGERTLIDHALAEAARAGFQEAVVVTSPGKPMLQKHLLGADFGLRLSIATQPTPAGPGHAVLCADVTPPVGVLVPDDVTAYVEHWIELRELHRQTGAPALCVREVAWETTHRFGIADCVPDGGRLRVRGLREKPPPGTAMSNLAIFGRYILTEPVWEALGRAWSSRRDQLELTSGFADVLDRTPVYAVRFRGVLYDCGTPEAYARSTAAWPV